VRVIGLWFTAAAGPVALFVEAIFPDQVIGVGEGVLVEDKCPARVLP